MSSIETVEKNLIKFNNIQYKVSITKDGSKFKKFELSPPIQIENFSSLHSNTPKTFLETDASSFMQNVIILDSIKSGIGRDPDIDIANIIILPILSLINCSYKYYASDSRHFISSNFINKLSNFKKGSNVTILIISGDTSISELINGLTDNLNDKLHLNFLPIAMGTANALANSIKLNCPIEAFSKFISMKLTSKPLPLYKAIFPDNSSTIFFIIFSMGFHANLLHLTNNLKYKSMGLERFHIAAIEILQNYKLSNNITVTDSSHPPNTIFQHSFAYFALIAMPNLETTYIPSPRSNVIESELHALGHLDALTTETLTARIMQGYKNKIGDDLDQPGTVYTPISNDCEVLLNINEDEPSYRSEVCLDGLLYNLRDFISVDQSRNNKIRINFINSNVNGFDVNILLPVN